MKRKTIIIFSVSIVILFFCSFFIAFFVYPRKYKNFVYAFSDRYNLETALVYSIIKAESDFNSKAKSDSGAIGLMQLMPSTANWIANKLGYDEFDLYNPKTNIEFGCFYLNYLFKKFVDLKIVICAYNAGEGRVCEWISENDKLDESLIDYAETKAYLKNVLNYYRVYNNKFLLF